MPSKAMKFCNEIGCNEMTNTSRCAKHTKDYKQSIDGKSNRFWGSWYSTTRWRDARLNYLRRHPLCVICERHGRLTPAKVVDHKQDHKGCKDLFWDINNFQSLCEQCHNRKTISTSGFGKRR
jgi:5-methylcytosine-specific restriction protein A